LGYISAFDFDGNTWVSWTALQKLSFLTGFISASSHVIWEGINEVYYSSNFGAIEYNDKKAQKVWGVFYDTEKKKKTTFTRQEVSLALDSVITNNNQGLYKFNVFNITIGQLNEGLDLFYNDFKNKQIKLSSAIYVVKKQIEGASVEEIDTLSQWLRGGSKDFSKRFYIDKEGKKKFISFP